MNDDSFFSMNRLMEFGMSMAVAQQMVSTMNSAMENIKVNGVPQLGNAPVAPLYYAVLDGNPAGPFSEKEFSILREAWNVNCDYRTSYDEALPRETAQHIKFDKI
jgi:hypothetical protein